MAPAPPPPHRAGGSLMLASALALLSYVPFEAVARLTLAVCAVLFVADPFPPTSRLVSVLSVAVVAGLARALRRWRDDQQQRRDGEENEEHRPLKDVSNQTIQDGDVEEDERERKKVK